MSASSAIRILEEDNNKRRDLFNRLMGDLFVAMGYDRPRLNIHKPGREIDLYTDHRLEARRAIGVCKPRHGAIVDQLYEMVTGSSVP